MCTATTHRTCLFQVHDDVHDEDDDDDDEEDDDEDDEDGGGDDVGLGSMV